MQLRSHAPSDVSLSLNALPWLVDAVRGPIRSLRAQRLAVDDPAFCHYHAVVGSALPRRNRPAELLAGGSALTWQTALAKAVGESVERYCVMVYEPQVRFARARELREAAPDPLVFDLFHPAQRASPRFPFARLTDDSRIGWIEGYSLTRAQPTLMPAALAHLYYRPQADEVVFDRCPLSGYAAGNTLEEALLGALCEVVERDALMIAWYHRLCVPALDLGSFDSPAVQASVRRFGRSPVRLFCADITSDVAIPAVLMLMTSCQSGWPAAVVATAADLSAERAVLRALGELSSGHALVRSYWQSGRATPRRFTEVTRPEDHALFYAEPGALRYLDAFVRPRSSRRAAQLATPYSDTDVKANLDECVRRLAAQGLEAIAVELTTPEVGAHGLRVVKVLVPGMQPLDCGNDCKHLGASRLYDAPRRMGYAGTARHPSGLNRAPHPFP